jgi:asparagine synthase (glutamine-hydrolysing)
LSGPLTQPPSAAFTQRVVRGVASERHDILRELPAELTGCVLTPERIFIFRGLSSADQIFFRRTQTLVEWSADSRDLLDGAFPHFDRETIWRSCRGEDVFVYPNLGSLRPGELVIFNDRSTRTVQYETAGPLELPRRTTLREYADLTYDLLVQETRPYAAERRVGILLSGGVDSATVLAALVDNGADVVAYHMGTNDPLADESPYVREVCRHLSVPLVTVSPQSAPESARNSEDGYFPIEQEFPHPFNHVWFRRIEQVADRIADDGVSVVLSGLEGDMLFGPLRYGLHDILTSDVSGTERRLMIGGLLSSRWELSRIIRSIKPSYSLYADPESVAEVELGSDFLTPVPGAAPESFDQDFSPQEYTLNLTLWRPRGICLAKPWGGRHLRRLAARLPDAYRLIPFRGRTIDKPVLRLAAAHRLPPTVWRHYGRTWLGSPDESWCLEHPDVLGRILGGPDTRLVAMGVVDRERLTDVLADPRALRRNAENLLCSAMVELFLRDLEKRTSAAPAAAPRR